MSQTLYFYDLETSGVNPREARVMQFAGQRTTLDLQPIGEPHNLLVRLPEDVLPDPEAILITGITPQQTQLEGITEAEFLSIFAKEIATPGTVFTGFNTVRFDDEFMRYMHYRNFRDPYEWQWKDDRSRWDLLDVVRMTRALRPDGIIWPFDPKGKPSNRLELLTSVNKLDHADAHDALSDVRATIALANLIRSKQPKLFDYLLSLRTKKAVAAFMSANLLFVYSSGKYSGEFEKTTVVTAISEHPKRGGALVYDLRFDPTPFFSMSSAELAKAWEWKPADSTELRLPVKLLQFNRCPAVAPLAVLDDQSKKRLGIDTTTIEKNYQQLQENSQWVSVLLDALKIMDTAQQTRFLSDPVSVEGQLYDDFFGDEDRVLSRRVLQASPSKMLSYQDQFRDDRLKQLLPLYVARNFPAAMNEEQRLAWDDHVKKQLHAGGQKSKLALFLARVEELSKEKRPQKQKHILEDLRLYGESLVAVD